jgi:hypothetical protein
MSDVTPKWWLVDRDLAAIIDPVWSSRKTLRVANTWRIEMQWCAKTFASPSALASRRDPSMHFARKKVVDIIIEAEQESVV